MSSPAEIFRVLGDPVRYSIVERLAANGESCACALLESFSITQPTLSHHMKTLVSSGLVTSRRVGTRVHYSVSPEALALLASSLQGLFECAVASRTQPVDSDAGANGSGAGAGGRDEGQLPPGSACSPAKRRRVARTCVT